MTRFKRKPSKLFIKYLISYLAILLVPLLIIGFFGYSYIKSIDAEKVIDDDVDSLTEAVKTVDNYLEKISRISFEMAGDQGLWGGRDKNEIRKVLTGYSVPDEFILKMFFYRRGDDVIYSSSGTIKLSEFITKNYNYEKWEYDDFYNSINSISSPAVRPGENVTITSGKTERYITYLLPLHSFALQSHGIVLLLIPEESIFSILNNVLKGYKSNTIVLNQQDMIITVRNKGSFFYYKLIDYVKLTPEYHNIETVVTKRQGYYIIYSTSGYSGWKYITITRSHEISSKVNRLKTTALYSLILIILIGGVAIGCFLHFNYNPIKKLKEYAEKRSIDDGRDTNEIDTIRSVIENISDQNARLQSRIKSHEVAVKEYLLFSLLRGQIKNREEFNARGLEIGLCFTKPLLFVVVFHMDKLNKIHSQDMPAIIDDLERSMPEEFGGYGRESIDGKRLIFVMCTEDNEDSVIAARLITCQKLLQEKWHISMSIGIGTGMPSIVKSESPTLRRRLPSTTGL